MQTNPIITLTTDFGYRDPFIGIMKGVILNINPSVTIIDITHGISPQNILEAALTIEMSFNSFPNDTIHVVVVDPGVGSMRRPLLVATDYHYFIGPDNGVFSRIFTSAERLGVFHVKAEHYFLMHQSSTFHGRDIFAPVAAWLSKGINISNFGDPVADFVKIQFPVPTMPSKNVIEGQVIYIDHFGNVITNIHSRAMDKLVGIKEGRTLKVLTKNKEAPLKKFYSHAEDKSLYSLINSFGYLELFVNKGNASSDFGIQVNEKVSVILT